MSHRKRRAFTLVELLVVIVVIVMLLALFMPPTISSREASRRATCMNNQRQLALALINHDAARGQLPGYANRIHQESEDKYLTSWFVPLLPYLDRNDLWQAWHEGDAPAVYMSLVICPSDPPEKSGPNDTPSSYVANCGLPGDSDTLADGVFFNHDVDSDPVVMSLGYISQHDGTQNTLLLSENIEAGNWTDTNEADIGMVWFKSPDKRKNINEDTLAGDRPQDIQYARPSSHHNGVVVATFCDGHVRTISEEIDYRVYQHLMTPDSSAAGVPGELTEADIR